MGIFSGINKARSTQGGLYLQPGNYIAQILRCKLQESQVGKRKFFIVEFKIIESDNGDMKKGSEPSWLVEVPGKYPELSFGNIKAFLSAAYASLAESQGEKGPSEEDIEDEHAEIAVSEDNPLAGVYLSAKAFRKATKNGGEFTRIKWGIPENLAALAA